MNEDKRTIEESITSRKRPHDAEYSNVIKRREKQTTSRTTLQSLEHTHVRYDFVENSSFVNEDSECLLERLKTIKQELNEVKSLLSDKDIIDWNRHTAYMNTSSSVVPYLRDKLNIEISTQAWAKMFEILANFDLVNAMSSQKWTTLHLCEAPGAFISALNHFLVTREETKHIDWHWYAQTLNPYYEHDESTVAMLIDDDRLIFHTIDEDHWDFGVDNSGNIMNRENINHYISRYQSTAVHLVTADGSFDVQSNPAEQELLVYPLLKTEVYVALSCLMTHGNFVLKLFTMFEQATIDLMYLLYRTFRQISIFKPQTSKQGNSEVYAVCIDFDRSKFANSFTDELQINPVPCSMSFLSQLTQCSELFQYNQINRIKNNLHYFHNQYRRFNKKLNKTKEHMLNQYLNQCQVRQLIADDRHLLNSNLEVTRFHPYNHRITRTGTFNDQHQIDLDRVKINIQNGFFCLICSNNKINDLCSTCHLLSQLILDRTFTTSPIHVGQLIAHQKPIINCVFGSKTKLIQNSCFCNKYLLKLCNKIDIDRDISDEDSFDLESIRNPSALEIPNDQFEKLRQFTYNYGINFQCRSNLYYVRSSPILTRLKASVIYVLTRTFEKTSVYVTPSCLLFVFETFQNSCNHDYESIVHEVEVLDTTMLLQFIDIRQLLDRQFVFNLIQANNICLQLKYVM